MAERTVLAGKDKVTTALVSDQRGAVAFEMLIVWSFLMMFLLLPLADVAVACFRYISAWQSLRAFGQSVQYYPPPDVTDLSGWKLKLPTAAAGYTISNLQVTVDGPIKYYSYETTVTLAPMVVTALCRGQASPCTYTLSYSERFQ